jgi:hypothetical protein
MSQQWRRRHSTERESLNVFQDENDRTGAHLSEASPDLEQLSRAIQVETSHCLSSARFLHPFEQLAGDRSMLSRRVMT